MHSLIYIKEVAKVKDELEHSGRTFLQNLLKTFTDSKSIEIIHESKRDKLGRGAPDFKFLFNSIEVGYLENKKIGEDLDKVLMSEQIKKYNTLSDNLILTDYLRWIWINKGVVIQDVRLCETSIFQAKSITLNKESCEKIANLINDFLSQKPTEIVKAEDLATALARPTRVIKDEISDYLKNTKEDYSSSKLFALLDIFKKTIYENITEVEFADAFAQTLTYSLFLTKLNLQDQNIRLSLNNISQYTPSSFTLIKDILDFIKELNNFPTIEPYVNRLLHIINHTNALELSKDLLFSKNVEKDPYIYFYENFLKAYDPIVKVNAGVYYTPQPVVSSIINNVDDILKAEFNLTDGIANQGVKLLDFACGTGTFLLQVFEKILSTIPENSLKKESLIKNHILKNIFGFELLIPAYCVAHLKLSQYLKENANYNLKKDDRIGVFLTNTLENRNEFVENPLFALVADIAKEGREAQAIKENNDILVITGNPPYNGHSQNKSKFITELIKPYFPNDDIKERNTKWLNDDYVKFMAFAQNKIAKAGKGVVGIITNNGFIDNPTFRQMRKNLMETFDSIYIIDLHGSTKKQEKAPDGGVDKNVFDIEQGVSISFFVKSGRENSEKNIYHKDVYGDRNSKFNQISETYLPNLYGSTSLKTPENTGGGWLY